MAYPMTPAAPPMKGASTNTPPSRRGSPTAGMAPRKKGGGQNPRPGPRGEHKGGHGRQPAEAEDGQGTERPRRQPHGYTEADEERHVEQAHRKPRAPRARLIE